ncbi:MAG: DNA mismatch repair protein MutS [Bermanella sp.]
MSLENGQVAAEQAESEPSIAMSPVHDDNQFQSDMFAMAQPSKVELELEKISPDDLTPREALTLLYKLKQTLNG